MDEYQDAESAFRSALRLSATNIPARHLFARFLIDRERPKEAIEILEAGLDYDSEDLRLRHTLAIAFAADDRNAELVVGQFRLATQSLIHHWPATFDLAVYLYLQGREREAKELFQELSELELDRWETLRPRALPAFAPHIDLQRLGTIVSLRDAYGFLRVEGHPFEVYLDRYHVTPQLDARLVEGQKLKFRLAFNLRGPTARDVTIAP